MRPCLGLCWHWTWSLWGHHLFKKGPLLAYLNICFQTGFTHLTGWVLVLGGCWDNGEILCWFKKCLSRISRLKWGRQRDTKLVFFFPYIIRQFQLQNFISSNSSKTLRFQNSPLCSDFTTRTWSRLAFKSFWTVKLADFYMCKHIHYCIIAIKQYIVL